MALTPLRWIALAVGGALVVLTLLLRDQAGRRWTDERWALVRRASAMGGAASNAADRVRMLELRDSIRAGFAKLGPADTSRVAFDPALGARVAPFRTLLAGSQRFRPERPAIGVDVVFVLDTARIVRGVERRIGAPIAVDYLLPAGASDRCVVIARVRPRDMSYLRYREYAQRLLGPCAFYERFGMPGPRVDEWLLSGGWAFAQHVTWFGSPSPWNGPSWAFDNTQTYWGTRRWMTPRGYRCVSGDEDVCVEALLSETSQSSRADGALWRGGRVLSSPTLAEWRGWRSRPLGLSESRLLADMVRTLGPERFQQFWRSGETVPVAFRQAAGRDLGSWTLEWATEAYGRQGRGPGVDTGGAVLAIGLVLVSAAGAGVAARRRQVR